MTICDKTDFSFAGFSGLFQLKAAWIGKYPPINAESITFEKTVNSRLPATLHGSFEVVWVFEKEIFEADRWELILDEAVRLLKKNGYLVIRFSETKDRTGFHLKSILGRNPLLSVKLCYQEEYKNSEKVIILSICRIYSDEYNKKEWTIGVLHDGRKKENIIKLIRSFADINSANVPIEFLIAGPKFELTKDLGGLDIRFVSIESQDKLARITAKKNCICKNAKYVNIAIFHDRYIVNDDFFEGFDKFGYDFDYITVAQKYENGSFFPGYAALPDRKLMWLNPQFETTYNTLYQGQYINGGLTIVKKHIIDACQLYNELLLWNEAEDVELSFYLRNIGIVPRVNSFSTATTIGINSHYTDVFLDLTEKHSVNVKHQGLLSMAYKLWSKLPFGIKQKIRRMRGFYAIKKMLLRNR